MNAVIFVRAKTLEGREQQVQAARKCAADENLEVIQVLDGDTEPLLTADVQVILVQSSDRLTRSLPALVRITQVLADRGVTIKYFGKMPST